MDDQLLITIKGAQKQLSLGRTKIYELVCNGDLEAVRIGKARRITVSSLRAFAERLSNKAAA